MELIVLLAMAVLAWLVISAGPSPEAPAPPPGPSRPAAGPGSPAGGVSAGPRPVAPFRSRIAFRPVNDAPAPVSPVRSADPLSGLRDAVTGAPVNPSRPLMRCGTCEVLYHEESYALLLEANAGRCVACLGTSIAPYVVTPKTPSPTGGAWQAVRCTLADYRQLVGQVVVFEGRCVRVIPSRSGNDHAVMFEDATWKRGFKMVVFRRDAASVGGPAFLRNLAGRRLTVRGLIVKHPVFGHQIVVTDRSMIGVA